MTTDAVVLDGRGDGAQLEVLVQVGSEGEPVVLVPSALRGAADFALLQQALADAGYQSFALNPRGAGRSTPPPPDITLRDVADDVAFVVERLAGGRAHLVGHALGNIVVRGTASYRPEVAATVAVMPCGGHDLGAHPVPPEVLAAFPRCHDLSLSTEERLKALQIAFFAPGNDARSWLDGWWPGSSLSGIVSTDPEEWWRAGNAPLLIMQPRNDAMAPIAVGRNAATALGAERVTYVELPQCGHAILPEQPAAVAANLIAFLRAHPLS